MACHQLLALLLFVLLASLQYSNALDYCDSNSHTVQCQSPEKLHSMMTALQQEIKQMKDSQDMNCTVCWSGPCLNGATCTPLSVTQYRCDCLYNYAGAQCEKYLECKPNTCGQHATCYIANHQINCVCETGFTGNPYAGCTLKVKKTCMTGDPHYVTFDGQTFDYQGTCPYTYVKLCSQNASSVYEYFEVKGMNEIITPKAHVSWVRETEVEMYGQKIHIDRYANLFFNGVKRSVPFYYPTNVHPNVTISYNNYVMTITNNQQITVTFSPYNSILCVEVPDDEFMRGKTTLCGMGGNIDDDCLDDFIDNTGYQYPVTTCSNNLKDFTEPFGDTFITDDFLNFIPGTSTCLKGTEVHGPTPACDLDQMKKNCLPIQNAKYGQGPFAACQAMDTNMINSAYDDCTYDTCNGSPLCDAFAGFALMCQRALPNTQLDWRPATGCPQLSCQLHSSYRPCATGCPLTCDSPDYNQNCTQGCMEGCECDPGYFLDNGDPANQLCVKFEDCGCKDGDGNYHRGNITWLSDDCSTVSICTNGSLQTENKPCSADGTCTLNNNRQHECVCNKGYEGDGYNCTDINECLNPHVCNVFKLQGTCNNTPGSYYCTCHPYYDDHGECATFLPLRHCADLNKYFNVSQDGVYTIKPPYPLGTKAAFDDTAVYCDMTTDDGGWTLMSSSVDDHMAEKLFTDYVAGFGDPALQDLWLGLEFIHQMTKEVKTSLRVNLVRCPKRGKEKRTYCIYPEIKVCGADNAYTATLPNYCDGSEFDYLVNNDGWLLGEPANLPFAAFDQDPAGCSGKNKKIGWWYDTRRGGCGIADLNGITFDCNNLPDQNDEAGYLEWDGNLIKSAQLYLRPADYPDYDLQVKPPRIGV